MKLLYFQKPEYLDRVLEERREEFSAAGLSLQPMPYFVGPLAGITDAGFIINGIKYGATSPLAAVDRCFRSFHALDCEYPQRAITLWLFIQKCGYCINLSSDKVSRSLNGLIGEIAALF